MLCKKRKGIKVVDWGVGNLTCQSQISAGTRSLVCNVRSSRRNKGSDVRRSGCQRRQPEKKKAKIFRYRGVEILYQCTVNR